MTSTSVKVGDTVFEFDENRRVYRKGESGPPIWREHWRPVVITGETSKSWLYGWCGKQKIPKSGSGKFCFSVAELDEREWAHENRYRLARAVENADAATLRKIAAIVEREP
jgi:hypothetical protein